ncbi:MAG TPA: crotonase [Planctomycetes bacterium]|nr:crotonase [Planctomycetota bacterium]
MNYENLQFGVGGGVATITVNRPKVMNALNGRTLEELGHVLDVCRDDEGVRAVIVTGSGDKAFVAGADIGELAKMNPLSAKALARRGQLVFEKLERLGKPTVAMINGFALGGGLELALACSLRTAATTARVGLPEVSLGIIPGYGGTQRLSRIAGPGVAREWILTGDMFSAEEAHRVGVVNRLFEPGELGEGTRKMVDTILSRGPVAVRFALEAILRGNNMPQREGEIMECDLFGLAASTEDMKEGMGAFLEKRKPEFNGR